MTIWVVSFERTGMYRIFTKKERRRIFVPIFARFNGFQQPCMFMSEPQESLKIQGGGSNYMVGKIRPPPNRKLIRPKSRGSPSVPTALYVNIRIQHSGRIDGTFTPGTWENWKNKVFHQILSIPFELMIFWFLQTLEKKLGICIENKCHQPLLHKNIEVRVFFIWDKAFFHYLSSKQNHSFIHFPTPQTQSQNFGLTHL